MLHPHRASFPFLRWHLRVRQLHLAEGFVMLPALLEVKSAQIVTRYFNSSCKVREFKQKFPCAIRLLFTFIASFIIVHSLPLFSYLKLAVFWLWSASALLGDERVKFLQQKCWEKHSEMPREVCRGPGASSCSLGCSFAAVGIAPATRERGERGSTSHNLPVNNLRGSTGKTHLSPRLR